MVTILMTHLPSTLIIRTKTKQASTMPKVTHPKHFLPLNPTALNHLIIPSPNHTFLNPFLQCLPNTFTIIHTIPMALLLTTMLKMISNTTQMQDLVPPLSPNSLVRRTCLSMNTVLLLNLINLTKSLEHKGRFLFPWQSKMKLKINYII